MQLPPALMQQTPVWHMRSGRPPSSVQSASFRQPHRLSMQVPEQQVASDEHGAPISGPRMQHLPSSPHATSGTPEHSCVALHGCPTPASAQLEPLQLVLQHIEPVGRPVLHEPPGRPHPQTPFSQTPVQQ